MKTITKVVAPSLLLAAAVAVASQKTEAAPQNAASTRNAQKAVAMKSVAQKAVALPVNVLRVESGSNTLLDAGVYRVGYQIGAQETKWFPSGWTGIFDNEPGIAYDARQNLNGRRALLLHTPWRKGTGRAIAEYDLQLPRGLPLRFTTAIALTKEAVVGGSDGVTFRATLIDGKTEKVLLDENRRSSDWKDFSFDLSRYAGRRVTLRLETLPGPANNANFDYSLWAEPTIVAGSASQDSFVVPLLQDAAKADAPLTAFVNTKTRAIAPSPISGTTSSVSRSGNVFTVRVMPGGASTRDIVIYRWDTSQPFLSGLTARSASASGGVDEFAPCAGSGITLRSGGEAKRDLMAMDMTGREVSVTERYENASGGVTLTTTVSISGGSLAVRCAQNGAASTRESAIASVSYGALSGASWRRALYVPYASQPDLSLGEFTYLRNSRSFVSFLPDWTQSNASFMAQRSVRYDTLTDGATNELGESVYLTVAPRLAATLPNLPNPTSPGIKNMSQRVVIDTWRPRFSEIESGVKLLKSYGIDDALLLVHNWQRDGYDQHYPTVLPANNAMGGDAAMKSLSKAARDAGYLFGLHENYTVESPESEGYVEADTSKGADGKPRVFNELGNAIKPEAYARFAARYAPQIHAAYNTSASFVDSHACIPPWFEPSVDLDTTQPNAGKFRAFFKNNAAMFDELRRAHKGPAFSEGCWMALYAGYLDGVEAQLASTGGGENLPVLPDFALLKMQPLQFDHGVGYFERWLSSGYTGEWAFNPATELKRDKYRATTVAYGHAAFLADQWWRMFPDALREYSLMRPLMARYAGARVKSVSYEIGGKMVASEVAFVAGSGASPSKRVRVIYENGLQTFSNIDEKSDWNIAGVAIPPCGFFAKAPGMVSGTTRRNGIASDYREGDGTIYADARSFTAPRLSGDRPVAKVEPADVQKTGKRSFRVTYRFDALLPTEADTVAFVHLYNANINIAFQQDHGVPFKTTQWKAGQTLTDGPYDIELPEKIGQGTYQLAIGLVAGAQRYRMTGDDLAGSAYVVADVKVDDDGNVTVASHQNKPKAGDSDAPRNAAGAVVNFGKVATRGAFALKLGARQAQLFPAVRNESFEVTLRTTQINPAWRAAATSCEAFNEDGKSLGKIALRADANALRFDVKPGVARYVLKY